MPQSRRIDWIARFGFAMRGGLYILLGGLALDDAAGHGTESAFDALRRIPGGPEVAVLGALGLMCFALFQIADAVLNLDERQATPRGWAGRLGRAGTGLVYGVIAVIGAKLALLGGDAGSGRAGAHASATAMHRLGGDALVLLVGIGFVAGAIDQLAKACTASFRKQLRPGTPRVAVLLGRIGFAGHGAIIAVLAYLIIQTALTGRAHLLGVGPAIDDLQKMGWVYDAVALSLIGFGVFSLLQAWYRRIDQRPSSERSDRQSEGRRRDGSICRR